MALGVLLIVTGWGYLAATRSLDRSIRGGPFLSLISRKSAVKLNASECGYLPIVRRGLLLRSAGILARGRPPHHLVELSAINLQAHCSLGNLGQRKLTVPRLEASHLQAAYGEAAAARLEKILPGQPNLEPAEDTESLVQIDIRETDIQHTDVYWGSKPETVGGFKDVNVQFVTKDHGLEIFGRGGTFQQTGWPGLTVDELQLTWSQSGLLVRSGILSLGAPRNFNVTGELQFGEHGRMRLHVSSKRSPTDPFVRGYWRAKFDGVFDSENDLEKDFVPGSKTTSTGKLNFSNAIIHDVEVLKKIAVVTQHPQFEKPKLDRLRFHYRWTGERLEVSNFEAEAHALCRLEGNFSIENNNLDGDFKIGAAPDVVEKLPGAREEVFTESRNGYLWTSLKLNGPANHPREDLKPRLISAAQKHFMRGLLSPVLIPGKALIEILQDIYQ